MSSFVLELAVGIASVTVGCILFAAGNRLFGRKTGGKRLVIFAAGTTGITGSVLFLRWLFSKGDAPLVGVIFSGAVVVICIGLVIAAFASEEAVEEAYNVVLRSF